MTTEVDPYEAIIKLAQVDAGLVAETDGRIDVWHHYGQDPGDWPLDAKGLIFVPIGGEVVRDTDGLTARPLLEARCYGDTPFDCGLVWRRLNDFTSGHNERRTIAVNEGTALVYYIYPASAGMPRLQFDEDVRPGGGMPFYQIQLEAAVSLSTVT